MYSGVCVTDGPFSCPRCDGGETYSFAWVASGHHAGISRSGMNLAVMSHGGVVPVGCSADASSVCNAD
jgi:hypothetical protein